MTKSEKNTQLEKNLLFFLSRKTTYYHLAPLKDAQATSALKRERVDLKT
jgi:hypothetical protein